MSFNGWLRNLVSGSHPSRASVKRRPPTRFRPCLEALEVRLTPAVHTWQGAFPNPNDPTGKSALWSDPGNWLEDQSP